MADNICSPITSNSTVKKNQKASSGHNVINLTTSESLRISASDIDQQLSSQGPESGVFLSHSTPNSRNVNKGGSSFQITSVITGSRMSNGEDSEEDYSRLTDFENETPSYSEDTISKEDVDVFLYNTKQGVNISPAVMGIPPMVLQPTNITIQEHIQKNAHEAMQDYDINIKVPQLPQYGNNLDNMTQKTLPIKPIIHDETKDINLEGKKNVNVLEDVDVPKEVEQEFKTIESALNSKLHNDTNTNHVEDFSNSQLSSKDNTLTQDIINTVENAFSKDINTSVENINNIRPHAININTIVENGISKHNDIQNASNNIPARTDRFKVVKIESTEPFKRGRWVCMDYLDKNEYNTDNATNNHNNANVNKLYEKNEVQDGEVMDNGGSKMGSPIKDNKMSHQTNTMPSVPHHQSLTQQMLQCLSTSAAAANATAANQQDNNSVSMQGQSMPTEFFNDKYVNQPSIIQNPMSSSTGPPVSMSSNQQQQQHNNTNDQPITQQYYTSQVHTSMNSTIPTSNNVSMVPPQTIPVSSQAAHQPLTGTSMNNIPNIQNMPNNVQQGMSLPTNINQITTPSSQPGTMNHQMVNQPQTITSQPMNVSQQVSGSINTINNNPPPPSAVTGGSVTNINSSISNTNISMSKPMMNHASGANTEAIAREKLLEAVVIVGTSSGGSTEDGDSTSTTNAVAIDNKIEQAMDLVKSHLMFAVREEVEVLKEKISELMERINMLELENGILRAHATQDTLAQLKTNPAPTVAAATSVTVAPTTTPVSGVTPNTVTPVNVTNPVVAPPVSVNATMNLGLIGTNAPANVATGAPAATVVQQPAAVVGGQSVVNTPTGVTGGVPGGTSNDPRIQPPNPVLAQPQTNQVSAAANANVNAIPANNQRVVAPVSNNPTTIGQQQQQQQQQQIPLATPNVNIGNPSNVP